MKRLVWVLGSVLLVSGCSGEKDKGSDDGDNPIDALLAAKFEAEGITPVAASNAELCRRLSGDLLGHFVTKEETSDECSGRTATQIARRFQSRDEYLLISERRWRDRLLTNDIEGDWRDLKEVYGFVDDLHRGDMRYDDFVLMVSAHPGFMGRLFTPEEKASLAIRAFLGRTATGAEAADFASLYRLWLPVFTEDPDFYYIFRVEGGVVPFLCEPLTSCSSDLLGGGLLDTSVFSTSDPNYEILNGGIGGYRYASLTAAQLSAVQEPGRVLIRQPALYEAAADEILNRLLDWSDGGRFPREPGIVLPEVRELLADYLEETGDYPAAERLVLGSWLYRQAADITPDGYGDDPVAPVPPIYQHGPVKSAIAETWIDSARALTFDLNGTCDPRYTDGFPYFVMLDALNDPDFPELTEAQIGADVQLLYEMMEDRRGWDETGGDFYPFGIPDFTYDYVANLIGGCPGFDGERQAQTGLSYAFTQETLAELLCQYAPEGQGTDTEVADILEFQMGLTFGRNPTSAEIADFETAAATCVGEECTPAGMRNQVCVGLLGAMPMIFY